MSGIRIRVGMYKRVERNSPMGRVRVINIRGLIKIGDL